jgi:hypothetical protein
MITIALIRKRESMKTFRQTKWFFDDSISREQKTQTSTDAQRIQLTAIALDLSCDFPNVT